MKKITLISGYYYPEQTAIGLYNTQMVEYLEKKGYEVSVITGFPNYPEWKIRDNYKDKNTFFSETIGNTKVYRYKQYVPSNPTFLKRIFLIMSFTYGSLINIFKVKECDLVFSTVPFTSTMLLGWILKKRTNAKQWNHVQDFEFDAALETGVSKKIGGLGRLFFKCLYKIETFLLNRGDVNSTIGLQMVDKIAKKSKVESFFFPNWIESSKINPDKSKPHKYLNGSEFKILYSGNIGDKQDWELFLSFLEKLKPFKVKVIVIGAGARKEWLCQRMEHFDNVEYHPPVEYEELSDLLCSADLHILFQKSDLIDSLMPSKILGMMASAKPSLVTGNTVSEVKKVLEKSGGGFYVANRDVDKCVAVVKELINSKEKALKTGINAREYIVNEFSKDKVLPNFEKKLSEILLKA